ncbi:MAG: hypothetical protein GXO44_03915, partial [Deferribacteres bacterium]|nr:hypothetical protein [Deferribacteres bacterium]
MIESNKKWPDEFAELRTSADELNKAVNDLLKEGEQEIRNLLNKRNRLKSISYSDVERLINLNENIDKKLKANIKEINDKMEKLKGKLGDYWDAKKVNENNEKFFRLPIDSSFFKNFMFYNTSKGILKQKDDFFKTIVFDIEDVNLQKINKTVNKFFSSFDEFANEFFTEFSIKNFREKIPSLFIYLLSF